MDNMQIANFFDNKKRSKQGLIDELSEQVKNCKKCELWKTRNKSIVGDGNINADVMIVGESPGYNEDVQGKAFVGAAGNVLNHLLSLVGLKRGEIYITNVLKCHPPRNHSPSKKEIGSCIPFLKKQIEIIKPRIIFCLGKFASNEIFNMFNVKFTQISELHGQVFEANAFFGKLKLIPLFHPAVACYRNYMLETLENDFKGISNLFG